MHDNYPGKWKINDNISLMVQDMDIVAIER